jgi:pimeloyl-ACP methyl ester carboxylesterase
MTQRAMPTTETPALVLWGSKDKILAAWQAERFGRIMPNARCAYSTGMATPSNMTASSHQ